MLETIRTVARSLGVHHTLGLTYEPTVPHHPPAVVAPDVGAGGGVSPGHSALPTDVEREDNHYYSQSSLASPHLTSPHLTSPGIVGEPVYPARLKLIFSSFLPHEIIQVVRGAIQEDKETAVLLDHSEGPEVD